MLNELEWIAGHIYANVWQTSLIAIIDPATGLVVRWIDMRALHPVAHDFNATPNGIAYDKEQNKLFLTGKLWPVLYEVALIFPSGEL
jgi:glutamine cyclotransferase